jgi:hypothetical protein
VGLAFAVKYVYLACKYNTSCYVKACYVKACYVKACYVKACYVKACYVKTCYVKTVRSDLILCQNYFAALVEEHLFSATSIPDQVALLAVFMPTLRSCADSYVKTWNRHKIRKQPKRPWVVAGKPIVLYYQHISRQDHKIPADPTLMQALREDIARWDEDEYLPHDTLAWCIQQL